MSDEQASYNTELAAAEARLEAGPSSSEYEPGSPSEHYVPAAIIEPATAFGEEGSIFTYEVLTDREDTNT